MAAVFFKKIGKFFLILLIVLTIIFALLYSFYLLTYQPAEKYISDDYLLYIKVDSIKKIYDNFIDLRAAEVILSNSQLAAIYNALLDFKAKDISKSFLLRSLLTIKTDIVLLKDYSPIIILNPKFKSVLTRFLPLLKNRLPRDWGTLSQLPDQAQRTYRFTLKNGQQLFFAFQDNLIFLSLKKDLLDKIAHNRKSGRHIYQNKQMSLLRQQIRKGGMAEIYLSTEELKKMAVSNLPQIQKIASQFSLSPKSSLSFDISNDQLFLSAFTNIEPNLQELKNFLTYSPSNNSILKYLPDSTNIYSSLNFKSFKDFYRIFLYFQKEKFNQLIEKVDQASQILLKMDIEELLFNWIGTEIGLLTMNTSSDPTLFVKIGDQKKLALVLEKLHQSLPINIESSLVLDQVRINKIAFPELIRAILNSFKKGIDAPYFITIDDFIFFSMNHENLSSIANKYYAKQTLTRDQTYKKTSRVLPENANIFIYYDLGSAFPKFLESNTIVNKILKLYEKGVISIYFEEDRFKIDISASGMNRRKTRLFPGFPKLIAEGIKSELICANIQGSAVNELIYVRKDQKLVAADINNHALEGFPVSVAKESQVIINQGQNGAPKTLFVFSRQGKMAQFDTAGRMIDPYPVDLDLKMTFTPLHYGRHFLLFSLEQRKLFFIHKNKAEKKEFSFQFKSPLLSAPTFYQDKLAFYAKDFSGTVYLTDLNGQPLPGWPRQGGGISYCSPVLASYNGKKLLLFLTQKGQLNLWNLNGSNENHFPIQLQGIYYTEPVIGNLNQDRKEEIVVLNKEGQVSIINSRAELIMSQKIKGSAHKQNKLLLYDFDRDKVAEIFIYGGSHFIIGLDHQLQPLPGFPVKGNSRPNFSDINHDGLVEMITAGIDDQIYIYSLDK